ncbi:Hemopexin [Penicillium waksmanii]|uniref:Hemopexin n=1 Tax=Penicillium waksmanii TaxID=69791 RepID=UPI002548453D|nr:Hemopexin [Penicillium waksmanii]KAJ5984285.1 Hemopexin [Penicillium waksmanii]
MVDAAYWHPAFKQTYFFGGRRYARIKFSPSTNDDMISWGPDEISERWPSLVSIGFGTVDAILPVENSHNPVQHIPRSFIRSRSPPFSV